ncbi:MAG: aminotransferase class III-fold pyridoxal phosphate-dependent enzyme [bacterium]
MEKTLKQIKTQAISDFKKHINLTQFIFLNTVGVDIIESDRNGVFMSDLVDGRKFIDCFCSAGSFNVGRCSSEIRAALTAALDDYDMGDSMFVSREKARLANKLAEIAPGDLNHVILTSGGGEAIDTAIKLARGYTGKPGIVAMIKAYHGHTGFALSAIGKPVYRDPFEPLMPNYTHAPFNDLEAVKKAVCDDTAAIIFEPVQGEAGIFPATQEFVSGLRRFCDERNVLLIFDEVQTGFGRTGKMFCAEHYGVAPDIMAVAKSLSGALYPISATLFNEKVNQFVMANPEAIQSGSGGTDLGCVAGLAVIDYMLKNDIPGHVAKMGDYIGDRILKLAEKHKGLVKEVRRKGLMIGLEYTHDMMGPLMTYYLGQNGVFAIFSGNNTKVMRLMPPLVISEKEADMLVAAMDSAMTSVLRASKLVMKASKLPLVKNVLSVQELQVAIIAVAKIARKAFPFAGGKGKK